MRKRYTYIQLLIAGIKEEGCHVFLKASVGGQSVHLLLDTGASRTVFDLETIRKISQGIAIEENEDKATGLGSNTVENFIGEVADFCLGDLSISTYQVGIIDLAHVNESYSNIGLPPIAGVLGSDILAAYSALISYKKKELRLELPAPSQKAHKRVSTFPR